MSQAFREATVARLQFADEQAKADFLATDGSGVNSDVVALAALLVEHCGHPILVTAARRDHGPDGNSPHSHESGDAFDFWVADYATAGDAAIGDALRVLAQIAREGGPVFEVDLGGKAQNYNPGGWPAGFDLFDDNSTDHVHVSAAPCTIDVQPPKAETAPVEQPTAVVGQAAPHPAGTVVKDVTGAQLAAIGEKVDAIGLVLKAVADGLAACVEQLHANSAVLSDVRQVVEAIDVTVHATHDDVPVDAPQVVGGGGGGADVDGLPQLGGTSQQASEPSPESLGGAS